MTKLSVSVHVVGASTTCQPIPPSRHLAVHASRASVLPSAVGETPAAVQDDIRPIEARVAALATVVQRLEATVQQVTERLQQDARASVQTPPAADADETG